MKYGDPDWDMHVAGAVWKRPAPYYQTCFVVLLARLGDADDNRDLVLVSKPPGGTIACTFANGGEGVGTKEFVERFSPDDLQKKFRREGWEFLGWAVDLTVSKEPRR